MIIDVIIMQANKKRKAENVIINNSKWEPAPNKSIS